MIDTFAPLSVSGYERLERSLNDHYKVLFDTPLAEVFNQQFKGSTTYANDGRRRSCTVKDWTVAAFLDSDTLTAISTLHEAVKRVLRALPGGYMQHE